MRVTKEGIEGPITMLLLGDSTFVLLRGERTPLNPVVANHMRRVLAMAQEDARDGILP